MANDQKRLLLIASYDDRYGGRGCGDHRCDCGGATQLAPRVGQQLLSLACPSNLVPEATLGRADATD